MAMTTPKKDDVEQESEARRLRREFFDDEMLDKLMAATDERGLSLTGEGGFLPEMIKAVLERGMQAELTDHLGYEKGDPGGHGSGNSGVSDGLCKRRVSHLKEIDYGYDHAEEGRRRAGVGGSAAAS